MRQSPEQREKRRSHRKNGGEQTLLAAFFGRLTPSPRPRQPERGSSSAAVRRFEPGPLRRPADRNGRGVRFAFSRLWSPGSSARRGRRLERFSSICIVLAGCGRAGRRDVAIDHFVWRGLSLGDRRPDVFAIQRLLLVASLNQANRLVGDEMGCVPFIAIDLIILVPIMAAVVTHTVRQQTD
ncbi:hypothetical protein Enr8_24340 [Blastopirellula retiformator]|uniref:Uncharacterized protein n=1 Tax=Blastopirellula retiformator TaxID=2527970 RepID=A0A5C5V3W7_9BACT|nr:hypothetical protein Enr8_24340 [Blastopirellula retiformator]